MFNLSNLYLEWIICLSQTKCLICPIWPMSVCLSILWIIFLYVQPTYKMHYLSDPKQMYHFFDLTFVCPPILSDLYIKWVISLSLTKCVICLTWHWSVHNFCLTYIDGQTDRLMASQINVWVGQMSRSEKCLGWTNVCVRQISGLKKCLGWTNDLYGQMQGLDKLLGWTNVGVEQMLGRTNLGVGQMLGLDKCVGQTNVSVGQMSGSDKCQGWTNLWAGHMSGLNKCLGWTNVWAG